MAAAVRDHALDTSAGAIAATVTIGAVALPGYFAKAETAIDAAKQSLAIARERGGDAFVLSGTIERRHSTAQTDAKIVSFARKV